MKWACLWAGGGGGRASSGPSDLFELQVSVTGVFTNWNVWQSQAASIQKCCLGMWIPTAVIQLPGIFWKSGVSLLLSSYWNWTPASWRPCDSLALFPLGEEGQCGLKINKVGQFQQTSLMEREFIFKKVVSLSPAQSQLYTEKVAVALSCSRHCRKQRYRLNGAFCSQCFP